MTGWNMPPGVNAHDIPGNGPEDGAPYDTPVKPFQLDDDGDVVDANGWLVCCPAYFVWPNDDDHRAAVCTALNQSL